MRALLLSAWLAAAPALAEPLISDRQFLVEAIEAVRSQGIVITWSDALVKPWMRVRETPAGEDPITQLQEVLAPHGLALEAVADQRWLVVRGTAPVVEVVAEAPPPQPADTPPAPAVLDEVRIVASRYTLFEAIAASDQFMTGEEIRLLPHLADDAFRALHPLPGVAANDYSAAFNLRGGAIGEVKVVLDGLELFEPYHMRTLFNPLSIIDPGIIGSAQVLSGGFTADNGNHMSGVVDITSAEPGGPPAHEVGVSFVSSFARSAGDWGEDGSYQVSARRGYLDLIADAVTDDGEELSPRYSDLFARVTRELSPATRIAGQALLATDDTQFTDPADGEDFGGDSELGYAWFTIEHEPTDRVFLDSVLFGGQVETNEQGALYNPPGETVERNFFRDVSVFGLQSELQLLSTENQVWMFGLRYRDLAADYDYFIDSVRQAPFVNNGQPYVVQRDLDVSSDGHEIGAWARYRFRATERSSYELGLRWDRQSYTDTGDDTQLSPRLNALFQVGERSELRLGWGYYHQPQGIHELQIQDGETGFYPAERAEHRVVGFRHLLASGMELQADLYQKLYSDLRPRYENALDTYEFAPESNYDRIRVAPESAEARGVELTVRDRQGDRLDWWLSYTWSKAEDLIEGVTVPRSWDQRHALTGNLTWRGEKWMASMVARYHSGWPRTPLLVTPVVDAGGSLITIETDLSNRNQDTYDDYFRLDLRLTRMVDLDRGSFEFYFEIFNLLDTENQCCIPDYDLTLGETVSVQPNIDDYLPLFPSFGFVWRFGPGAP